MTISAIQTELISVGYQISDCEFSAVENANTHLAVAREMETVRNDQNAEGQAYMKQHMDDEGVTSPTMEMIEYVNSNHFNAKYDAIISALSTKEKTLDREKTQIETKHTNLSARRESLQKELDKDVTQVFGTFK